MQIGSRTLLQKKTDARKGARLFFGTERESNRSYREAALI